MAKMKSLQPAWHIKGKESDPTNRETGTVDTVIAVKEGPPNVHIENMSSAMYGQPITAKLAVELMANLIRLLQDNHQLPQLKHLIEAALGITFDRSMLLKILSQPQCEGLRFYPCVKVLNGTQYFSLVVVGVDALGFDLNYTAVDPGKKLNVKDLDGGSLTSEYAHPPDTFESFRPNFILHGYASKIAGTRPAIKTAKKTARKNR